MGCTASAVEVDITRPGENLTAVPENVYKETSLENLDLSSNSITTISPEIRNLVALRTLSLQSNRLATLPPEIGLLASITRFALAPLFSLPFFFVRRLVST
jgi:Leucine-rich repeat (LRR) protein